MFAFGPDNRSIIKPADIGLQLIDLLQVLGVCDLRLFHGLRQLGVFGLLRVKRLHQRPDRAGHQKHQHSNTAGQIGAGFGFEGLEDHFNFFVKKSVSSCLTFSAPRWATMPEQATDSPGVHLNRSMQIM